MIWGYHYFRNPPYCRHWLCCFVAWWNPPLAWPWFQPINKKNNFEDPKMSCEQKSGPGSMLVFGGVNFLFWWQERGWSTNEHVTTHGEWDSKTHLNIFRWRPMKIYNFGVTISEVPGVYHCRLRDSSSTLSLRNRNPYEGLRKWQIKAISDGAFVVTWRCSKIWKGKGSFKVLTNDEFFFPVMF